MDGQTSISRGLQSAIRTEPAHWDDGPGTFNYRRRWRPEMKTTMKMLTASLALAISGMAVMPVASAADKGAIGISMPTKSSMRWIADGDNAGSVTPDAADKEGLRQVGGQQGSGGNRLHGKLSKGRDGMAGLQVRTDSARRHGAPQLRKSPNWMMIIGIAAHQKVPG